MTASEYLERRADEYQALAEEHGAMVTKLVEIVLRELAAALEAAREAA